LAEGILRDAVDLGIFSPERAAALRRSVRTVASSFVSDAKRVSSGELPTKQFYRRYGHLRPGTYDIRSKTYRDWELTSIGDTETTAPPGRFHLQKAESRRLSEALQALDWPVEDRYVVRYVVDAIRLREFGKFAYSKYVSLLLEAIAAWGKRLGIDRDELSYLPLDEIQAFVARPRCSSGAVLERARRWRADQEMRSLVLSPAVVWEEDQLLVVVDSEERPTFVTSSSVRAPIVSLSDLDPPTTDVRGKIVCAVRADPGYDWILGKGVAGIVTCYGGVNSHLAVRCNELGVPAAIGCGQALFRRLVNAPAAEIDCASQSVRPILGDEGHMVEYSELRLASSPLGASSWVELEMDD
jgi:hypothetical protein